MNWKSTFEVLNLTWRRGLVCEKAISLASSISSLADEWKVDADRVPHRFGDRIDLPELVAGRDLLAQVAQEVLLARDAHEVGVGVAVADVVEGVFITELLVAGLRG